MRALTIAAATALALTACGKNDQTDQTQNIDENLTAENIVANDVTAIDAVTAADANMAADVDFTDALANDLGNAPATSTGADKTQGEKRTGRPASSVVHSPRPSPKPVTSSPVDPVTNSD